MRTKSGALAIVWGLKKVRPVTPSMRTYIPVALHYVLKLRRRQEANTNVEGIARR